MSKMSERQIGEEKEYLPPNAKRDSGSSVVSSSSQNVPSEAAV